MSDHRDASYTVSIFTEEFGLLAGQAARSPNCETGGSFFGLRRSNGDSVIFLVTPPGRGAIANPMHFEQDVEEVKGWARELDRNYGLQYLGDVHSHHQLSLSHPSPEDAANMASISRKIGISGLAQWILTLGQKDSVNNRDGRQSPNFQVEGRGQHLCNNRWESIRHESPPLPRSFHVLINPFVYPEVACPRFEACSVNLLPGRSPVRRDLVRIDPANSLGLGFNLPPFPMERIAVAHALPPEISDEDLPSSISIPEELLTQLGGLPPEILSGVRCGHVQEGILIEVPLPEERTLRLVYDVTPRFFPSACYMRFNRSGDFIDVSARILNQQSLSMVVDLYQTVMTLSKECSQSVSCIDLGRGVPMATVTNDQIIGEKVPLDE